MWLFPARAGVIPIARTKETDATSFPRACGGDPDWAAVNLHFKRFSPRVRG